MKKIILLLCSFLLLLSLVGCDSKEPDNTKPEGDVTSDTSGQDTPTTPTNPTTGKLSNDWKENKIIIDGFLIELPTTTFQEIKALGYNFSKEEPFALNPNYFTSKGVYSENGKGDIHFVLGFANLTDAILDRTECTITYIGISAPHRNSGNPALNVELPGGIYFGSTKAEVEAVFGPADSVYEEDSFAKFTYKDPNEKYHTLEITFHEDGLDGYSLTYR
jgi:hypothetical protein